MLLHCDNIDGLRDLADNSIDALATDPPYGLGDEPDALAMLRDWLDSGHHDVKGKGFMGKLWDAFVPQPALWREVLRVLKPGAHGAVFCGTRTYDLMVLSLRIAGFEIRECVVWHHAQGFPKNHCISKAIDAHLGKTAERPVVGRGSNGMGRLNQGNAEQGYRPNSYSDGQDGVPITAAATPEAERYEGVGTALKPAVELIVIVRKPLVGTIAANVLKWGTGGLNIDGCRIASGGRPGREVTGDLASGTTFRSIGGGGSRAVAPTSVGRWPANLVLSHSPSCTLIGTAEVATTTHYPASRPAGGIGNDGHAGQVMLVEFAPRTETVEKWQCAPGCPVAELDRQSGSDCGAAAPASGPTYDNGDSVSFSIGKFKGNAGRPPAFHADSGGASHFFLTTPAAEVDDESVVDGAPFYYCPKAPTWQREVGLDDLPVRGVRDTVSRDEGAPGARSPRAGAGRGDMTKLRCKLCGLDGGGGRLVSRCEQSETAKHEFEQVGTYAGRRNTHPTKKPIDVMRWLVRLVTPPNGVCLDPFAGTGTTAVAAILENRKWLAMEREAEYVEFAKRQIAAAQEGQIIVRRDPKQPDNDGKAAIATQSERDAAKTEHTQLSLADLWS